MKKLNIEEVAPHAVNVFPRLIAAVMGEAARYKADKAFYVKNGYMPGWAENNRNDPDGGLKYWSTENKWSAYTAGTLIRDKAVSAACGRAERYVDKWTRVQLLKLENAAVVDPIDWIDVDVYWSRSRCIAEAVVGGDGQFSGSAGGWGYDRESAAVADALNNSARTMRLLYDMAETVLQNGASFTRSGSCVSWRDTIGYGSGYSIVPYFEGGVGVSCFWSIFRAAGYKVTEHYGKTEHFYSVSNN